MFSVDDLQRTIVEIKKRLNEVHGELEEKQNQVKMKNNGNIFRRLYVCVCVLIMALSNKSDSFLQNKNDRLEK